MPAVILVVVDQYDGPASMPIEGKHLVPVVPVETQWEGKGNIYLKKKFPLKPAYGMTVHKSQGLTLPKVVPRLHEKDVAADLGHVALSQIEALKI